MPLPQARTVLIRPYEIRTLDDSRTPILLACASRPCTKVLWSDFGGASARLAWAIIAIAVRLDGETHHLPSLVEAPFGQHRSQPPRIKCDAVAIRAVVIPAQLTIGFT